MNVRDKIQAVIVDVLLERGESLLNDYGVDEDVCNEIAVEILIRMQELYVKEKKNE